MADLVIKQAELQKLDQIIGEIPTKYGLSVVSFFQQINALRAQEAEAEKKQLSQVSGGDLVSPGYGGELSNG